MEYTMDDARSAGFDGFVSAYTLLDAVRRREIPTRSGVYLVFYAGKRPPRFSRRSAGGWFKGKDPTRTRPDLLARWVEDADVVYVGKATDLRERIRALVRFGAGHAIGHWGGYPLWQLQGSKRLVIAWRPEANVATAERMERRLIEGFVERYGQLPYANAF